MLKSRPDRYGLAAMLLHWSSALCVAALMITGFRAGAASDPAAKAEALRLHLPIGLTLLALTLARILWRVFFDNRPRPPAGEPKWRAALAKAVHLGFYPALLLMLGSGLALVGLSGAAPAIFGEPGALLPDFTAFAPRAVHGLGAILLMVLLLLHVGGALYHGLVLRDGTLARMWPGRGGRGEGRT